MEVILALIVIIVLLSILGVKGEMIVAGIIGLICLGILAMGLMFLYMCVRMVLAKKHKASFDRVLVDAPCSGTGTWRRNPDARWKQMGPGLDELTGLQGRILSSASRLVKAGGRLVYATCSVLAEENENQIETFLA
ncbi:MAG TPA: hypothetical protein PLY43_05490, partial [Ruminococcus sp.]|nr:hypothetical protein [Ruminococcus sp.]